MADPEQNLIFLTNRIGRQLAKLLLTDLSFEGYQPHGSHMGLLADLVAKDGQRQQDLAISTIKDKGTVARALTSLEFGGLIERKQDEHDRRQKRIYLTEKGRRMWCHAESRVSDMLELAGRDIAPEEMTACTQVLHQVYHNLHAQLSKNENE